MHIVYIVIIILRFLLSVRASVTEGHRKRFDLYTLDAVPGYRVVQATTRRFLCVSINALATGRKASLLDELYKKQSYIGHLPGVVCS